MRILLMLIFCCSLLGAVESHVYPVKEYRVIDGDTIEVTLDLGFNLTKQTNVRLNGVNTPEIRGDEREAGLVVKQFVEEFLQGKEIQCQWLDEDKYGGRFIGMVYVDGESLGIILVEKNYAKVYDGRGSMPRFSPEEIDAIIGE